MLGKRKDLEGLQGPNKVLFFYWSGSYNIQHIASNINVLCAFPVVSYSS